MLPDRVSNPGPLTYESGALPIALRGPALSALSDLSLNCFTMYLYRALGTIINLCKIERILYTVELQWLEH